MKMSDQARGVARTTDAGEERIGIRSRCCFGPDRFDTELIAHGNARKRLFTTTLALQARDADKYRGY